MNKILILRGPCGPLSHDEAVTLMDGPSLPRSDPHGAASKTGIVYRDGGRMGIIHRWGEEEATASSVGCDPWSDHWLYLCGRASAIVPLAERLRQDGYVLHAWVDELIDSYARYRAYET